MAVDASVLVEAVRRITTAEDLQAKLGLTIVGFATGFELVILVCVSPRSFRTYGGWRCQFVQLQRDYDIGPLP